MNASAPSVVPSTAERDIPSNIYKPKQPFMATVVDNRRITGPDSPNDVRHITVTFEGSGLWYLDGQSLGVLPPGADAEGKPHKLRLYSIASPGTGEGQLGRESASFCVKRLVYQTAEGETVRGVCSNYLCDLPVGAQVPITGPVGKAFLLPDQPQANLIMVATGTGIAPFRAFLQTRYAANPVRTGQTLLFFGVQYRSDFLYEEELAGYAADHADTFQLHTAFSREQHNAQGQRLYVQHRLAEQANTVLALLQQPNTFFYVCGLKGMETGILDALAQAAEQNGLAWNTLFSQLQQQKRWHVEVY